MDKAELQQVEHVEFDKQGSTLGGGLYKDAHPSDPVEERRLVRKIDSRLLPCLFGMYILNYIDRGNVASARLKGLEADTNLVGTEYSTVVSILYVTYVLLQVPSNMLMNRLTRPALYLCSCMMAWGLISALTSQASSFGGLVAVRLCLGLVESAFFPGALFLLSRWYTKKELALRSAVLYSAALLAGAFGNLFAAGVLSGMEGARGIRGWRWLFILEGSATILVSFICMFFLPDFPINARFLTAEERLLACRRLAVDAGEADSDSHNHKWYWGFILALKDPKVWCLTFSLWFLTTANSYNNFFPTLAGTLGYNSTNTLLLAAPPFIFAMIFALINARHADHTRERFLHICGPVLLAMIGCIIPLATTQTAARYVALFLLAGSYAGYVVMLAWLSNTISRPPAKRAAALAWLNASSNTGNIAGGYFFTPQYAPSYRGSFAIILALFAATIVSVLGTRLYLQRLNRQLDQAETERFNKEEVARMANLTGDPLEEEVLERTAELQGVNAEQALQMKAHFRYLV